jgi:Protein of unknown function (DUF3106)
MTGQDMFPLPSSVGLSATGQPSPGRLTRFRHLLQLATGWAFALALSSSPGVAWPQEQTAAISTNEVKATANPGSAWKTLAPAEQQQLAPLQASWDGLPPAQQAKWRSIAQSMATLNPVEQTRMQDRMREWSALSSAARAQARLNFQEMKAIPVESRNSLWEAYQQLPSAERDKLQAQSQAAKSSKSAEKPRGPAEPPKPKSNTLPAAPTPLPKAVSAIVVQAKPGATTRVMSVAGLQPLHHQAGLPKIVATDEFVDPLTLLPRRGPQAAEQWRQPKNP